jgi:hypothetical protein
MQREARWLRLVEAAEGSRSVVARVAIPERTVVTRWLGPDCAWADVPATEVIYVASLRPGVWTIPETLGRFMNHSCDPNCALLPDGDMVTLRAVAPGEELTHDYQWADPALFESRPDHYFWDSRWTFRCRCGAPGCRGLIDRYLPR